MVARRVRRTSLAQLSETPSGANAPTGTNRRTDTHAPTGTNGRTGTSARIEDAHQIALCFLAPRPRSEDEVRRRLGRAQVEPAVVEVVLERLRGVGLVNDAAFARYWLEQRHTFRPRGARLLRAELRRHGISEAVAEASADELGLADSAEDDAYRAAFRRATRLASLDYGQFRERIGLYLARRGFDWDIIGRVVDRLWAELSTA